MLDRTIQLKVKIKSLAAEAEIIRKEEAKAKDPLRTNLREHRITVVRDEARLSQLAYGFLRGKAYDQLEKNGRTFDSVKLYDMIVRFGIRMDYQGGENYTEWTNRLEAFKACAKAWVVGAYNKALENEALWAGKVQEKAAKRAERRAHMQDFLEARHERSKAWLAKQGVNSYGNKLVAA